MDHHRQSSRNPWLSLLLVAVVLVLSCAAHGTANCSTEIGMTDEAKGDDSGKNSSDCGHGRNHTHSHGHHGGSGGKDKPGTTTTTTPTASNSNPWVLSAGAAPRTQLVPGFTPATAVIVLATAAAVCWSLKTY